MAIETELQAQVDAQLLSKARLRPSTCSSIQAGCSTATTKRGGGAR